METGGVKKTCRRCLESKSGNAFHRKAANRDGLNSWCKCCRSPTVKTSIVGGNVATSGAEGGAAIAQSTRTAARSLQAARGDAEPPGWRTCSECHETKPEDCFHWRAGGRVGRRKDCKSCHNARHKAVCKQRRESKNLPPGHKTCITCWAPKPSDEFHAEVRSLDGLSSRCKDCWMLYPNRMSVHHVVGNKRTLPASTAAVTNTAPKRRGRPPKARTGPAGKGAGQGQSSSVELGQQQVDYGGGRARAAAKPIRMRQQATGKKSTASSADEVPHRRRRVPITALPAAAASLAGRAANKAKQQSRRERQTVRGQGPSRMSLRSDRAAIGIHTPETPTVHSHCPPHATPPPPPMGISAKVESDSFPDGFSPVATAAPNNAAAPVMMGEDRAVASGDAPPRPPPTNPHRRKAANPCRYTPKPSTTPADPPPSQTYQSHPRRVASVMGAIASSSCTPAQERRIHVAMIVLTPKHRLDDQAKILKTLGAVECARLLEVQSLPEASRSLVVNRLAEIMVTDPPAIDP